jgi:hypothetical protein
MEIQVSVLAPQQLYASACLPSPQWSLLDADQSAVRARAQRELCSDPCHDQSSGMRCYPQ